jgi:hypothetical protein
LGRSNIGNGRSATQSWKLISARDSELRLGFEHVGCRYAQVVILLKRGVD